MTFELSMSRLRLRVARGPPRDQNDVLTDDIDRRHVEFDRWGSVTLAPIRS